MQAGVKTAEIAERDGRLTLDFEDPEGQRLSLIDDGGAGEAFAWEKSPVPAAHQVRGLGPITLSVPEPQADRRGADHPDGHARGAHLSASRPREAYRPRLRDGRRRRGRGAARRGAAGAAAGAARAPAACITWRSARRTPNTTAGPSGSNKLRVPNSGKVDRFWFRSLYFREPNGILFEIASDGPGFGVDEPMDKLGEKLVLPPFLEGRRAQIEAGLKPM